MLTRVNDTQTKTAAGRKLQRKDDTMITWSVNSASFGKATEEFVIEQRKRRKAIEDAAEKRSEDIVELDQKIQRALAEAKDARNRNFFQILSHSTYKA